jgi:1-deoxy-D-xylulose-5-phosphate reductoisomerase
MQTITILGSTGSIGENTLDIISQNPSDFSVFALTAHTNVDKLFQQCLKFKPEYAVLVNSHSAKILEKKLKENNIKEVEVLAGEKALCDVAENANVDIVMAAIVGIAGLSSAYSAIKAGKKVLLANKESLVTAGSLFMNAVAKYGATLLPVDSEHNAIFQCMPKNNLVYNDKIVSEIILTASGGPFRTKPVSELSRVTPDEACAHPNWDMGRKISVDSATMMNKALEVIEAYWLFGVPVENLSVIIHPQSIIHSMVKYVDGSFLAQLGSPDMRTPITHCMYYPLRGSVNVKPLDLTAQALHFEQVNHERFPSIEMVFKLLSERNSVGAIIFNAVNELMVEQFLDKKIAFTDIVNNVDKYLQKLSFQTPETIEEVILLDKEIRSCVTPTQ